MLLGTSLSMVDTIHWCIQQALDSFLSVSISEDVKAKCMLSNTLLQLGVAILRQFGPIRHKGKFVGDSEKIIVFPHKGVQCMELLCIHQ